MKNYFDGTDLSIFVGAVAAAAIYYPWARSARQASPTAR